MVIIWATILTFALIFKSPAITISTSFLIILSTFTLSKGWIIGPFVGMVSGCLYAVLGYINHLYGELIVSVCVNIPIYILIIISWLRNISTNRAFVKVSKKFSLRECLVAIVCIGAISVGIYFLLRHFHTQNLVVSTLSIAIGILAGYMQMRCCEYSFVLYIVANIICIVLWSSASVTEIVNITTVVTYCFQTCLNAFGVLNWLKLKKQQNKDNFSLVMRCLRD